MLRGSHRICAKRRRRATCRSYLFAPYHLSDLLYAVLALAGACVLWVLNQFLTTVARDVLRKQGGEAVAEWVNRVLVQLRGGLRQRSGLLRRPLIFYVGNAVILLLACYMNLAKVFGFGATNEATAMASMFNLTLAIFLIPFVGKRWPDAKNADRLTLFVSGVMMMLCVNLLSTTYLLGVSGLIDAVTPR
jgi:hypothetical protein